ncbi:uncharacterized protein [Haliotis cracherodii]|uniref:uncharacterized protein n=1 Tax=Haliotis cracherodii TaxID=6455 RepID=UPI0039E8D480
MDNTSAVSFNISDILPPQEIAAECNATNMSSGCEGHDANQTNHLFDSIQHIIEITFTCCDVLNVLGNAVLMLLIYKATTKMEASGRLLVNQAVADAGMGLSWLVFYGNIYTNPQRDPPQTAILLQGVAISVFSCVSGLSFAMTLFALHIAICNPILYKVNNNPKVITIIIVVSWLVVTGCSILALTADNFLIQEGNSIIMWNVTKQNTWFVDLCCNIILPLAMMIIAFTRICLHMRKKENVSITSASANKRYVRQAKGIFVVYITYIVTFCPLFVFDFININYKSDNGILLVIIENSLNFLNYAYLVFKLPLFLLAFKSYRRVASQIFCQHLASGSSSGPSGDRGKLPQGKDQTATKINHRLDDKGHGEAARSTPIQMNEATEMKGNIGRVNHGFTGTCSLYHGDTARPNGAKDDVSSNTSDDVSNRPLQTPPSQPVHLKLKPPPIQHVNLKLDTTPTQRVHLKLKPLPSQHVHLKLETPPSQPVHLKLDTTPTQSVHLKLKPPPTQHVHLKLDTIPTQYVHLKLKPPSTQPVQLKLKPPQTQPVHLKLKPLSKQNVHLKLSAPPTHHVHLKLSTPPTQHVHLKVKPPPTQPIHLELNPPPNTTCTPEALHNSHTTCTPAAQASTTTTCTPEALHNSHTTCTPEARDSSFTTCTPESQASTHTTCTPEALHNSHTTCTPEAQASSHTTCTPEAQASTNTTCTPEAQASTNTTCTPEALHNSHTTCTPEARDSSHVTCSPEAQASTNTTCTPEA